jgi:serine/threonine protein phosphatase PrpC
MRFKVVQRSAGQSGAGDDLCAVVACGDRLVIAVADGAGGTGRGRAAATLLIDCVNERSRAGPFDVLDLLRDCDLALARDGHGAETTAVVAVVSEHGIVGASVGDSGAWIVGPAGHIDLTRQQVRKPLIGSGEAVPVPFGHGPLTATLLVATDGLFNYADAARLRELASADDLDAIPERLIDSVRLRSGRLQDDVAVLLCRQR